MRALTWLFVGAVATIAARPVEGGRLPESPVAFQNPADVTLQPLRPSTEGSTTETLQRLANLEVSGVQLAAALKALHAASNIPLVFSPDFVPEIIVACDCRDATVENALIQLLEGTNLQFVPSSGYIIVAPRAAGRTRSIELARASLVSNQARSHIARLSRRPLQRQGQIAGTVRNERTLEPIATVQVSIEGTGITTVTDADGRFTLNNVPDGTRTIIAQRIGYDIARSEVAVTSGETTTIDLVITERAVSMEELVVVGYGTQRRREISGSVASIRGSDIADAPVASLRTRFRDVWPASTLPKRPASPEPRRSSTSEVQAPFRRATNRST